MKRSSLRAVVLASAVLLVAAALVTPAAAQQAARETGWVEMNFYPADGPQPTPDSASICDVDTCLYVTGSGLHVSKWRTTAWVSSTGCEQAQWRNNGQIIRTETHCLSGPGWLEAIWHSPGYFSDGDKLCNAWTGVAGYPCARVHS